MPDGVPLADKHLVSVHVGSPHGRQRRVGERFQTAGPLETKSPVGEVRERPIGVTANDLTWVTGSEGSNPSLSARGSGNGADFRMVGRPGGSAGSVVQAVSGLVRGVWNGVGLYWLQTLGCPKNQVDSDKLEGRLAAQGYGRADDGGDGGSRGGQTCAFIDAARQESIDTVLTLADRRRPGARLIVTGCMAERYGDELRDALPEVDLVAGFGPSSRRHRLGTPFRSTLTPAPRPCVGTVDQRLRPLELPRPAAGAPWAYVKVAEGCDRHLRLLRHPVVPGQATVARRGHPGRGRRVASADDGLPLAKSFSSLRTWLPTAVTVRAGPSFPHRQRPVARRRADPCRVRPCRAQTSAVPLSVGANRRADRDGARHRRAVLRLSLQHVSRRCWPACAAGRRRTVPASHRGHPGGRARGHLSLLFHPRLSRARPSATMTASSNSSPRRSSTGPASSPSRGRTGTHAAGLENRVPPELALERLRECTELQDAITAAGRDALDRPPAGPRRPPGQGRTVQEAPEIDGIVHLPEDLAVGSLGGRRLHRCGGPRPLPSRRRP